MRIIIRSRSRSTWPTDSETGLAALRLDTTSFATVIANAPEVQALWAVRVDRGVAGPDAARSLVEISPASTGTKRESFQHPIIYKLSANCVARSTKFPPPGGPKKTGRPFE